MRRIVLPFVVPASIAADVRTVTAADVGIAVEVVVPVDVHVTASPTTAPAPTAAPRGAHGHTNPERDGACGYHPARGVRRVVNRWIGIRRRAIDVHRIIGGYVDHLGTRLFNYDYLLALYNLGLHFLLLVGRESTFVLCFMAHSLYGIHYVGLLREKRIAKICGPLNVVSQPLDHVRQRRHGLNARVPRLLRHRIHQRFVLQVLVALQPLLELDQFQRISGGHQRLAQQRVRIKRDGCDERFKLVGRDLRSLLRSRVGRLLSRRVGRLLRRRVGWFQRTRVLVPGCTRGGWLHISRTRKRVYRH